MRIKNLSAHLSRINVLSDAHKLRWKHIYRINSSMRIEKVMWLCAMRRDNLTNQRLTDLVHSIYMLLWSFWAKSVVKVFLYNCLTRLRSQTSASTSESNNRMCLVCSRWSHLCHIWKLLYSVASLVFLVIFSATVYQEVMILFSLTRWMETVIYSQMFYAILQFCT